MKHSFTKHVTLGLVFLVGPPPAAISLDQETKVPGREGQEPVESSSKSLNTEQWPLLSILVFNHAEVAPAELEEAKETAAAIFLKAGVHVEWRGFSPSTGATPGGRGALPLHLILAGENTYSWMKKDLGLPATALGFALTQPQGATPADTAYIFVNRVEELVRRERFARLGRILGHIIAHELGHLLLGRGHSANGLMSGEFGELLLKLAGASRLDFTRNQASRIREVVRQRTLLRPGRTCRTWLILIHAQDQSRHPAALSTTGGRYEKNSDIYGVAGHGRGHRPLHRQSPGDTVLRLRGYNACRRPVRRN